MVHDPGVIMFLITHYLQGVADARTRAPKQLLQNDRPGTALGAAPVDVQGPDMKALTALTLPNCEDLQHQKTTETSGEQKKSSGPRCSLLLLIQARKSQAGTGRPLGLQIAACPSIMD